MTELMAQSVRRVPLGIRLAVAMLVYFGLSAFLDRFLSRPLSQGLALTLVSIAAYPIFNERRVTFASHLLYSLLLGLVVFVIGYFLRG